MNSGFGRNGTPASRRVGSFPLAGPVRRRPLPPWGACSRAPCSSGWERSHWVRWAVSWTGSVSRAMATSTCIAAATSNSSPSRVVDFVASGAGMSMNCIGESEHYNPERRPCSVQRSSTACGVGGRGPTSSSSATAHWLRLWCGIGGRSGGPRGTRCCSTRVRRRSLGDFLNRSSVTDLAGLDRDTNPLQADCRGGVGAIATTPASQPPGFVWADPPDDVRRATPSDLDDARRRSVALLTSAVPQQMAPEAPASPFHRAARAGRRSRDAADTLRVSVCSTARPPEYDYWAQAVVVPEHRQEGLSWHLVAAGAAHAARRGVGGLVFVSDSNPMTLPDDSTGDEGWNYIELSPPRRFRGEVRLRRLLDAVLGLPRRHSRRRSAERVPDAWECRFARLGPSITAVVAGTPHRVGALEQGPGKQRRPWRPNCHGLLQLLASVDPRFRGQRCSVRRSCRPDRRGRTALALAAPGQYRRDLAGVLDLRCFVAHLCLSAVSWSWVLVRTKRSTSVVECSEMAAILAPFDKMFTDSGGACRRRRDRMPRSTARAVGTRVCQAARCPPMDTVVDLLPPGR